MGSHYDGSIIERDVEEEIKESYLRYAMSVIISRALPDVRDGLKPSQRRLLYAMWVLGLRPSGKHRKCAKIAGDTSGDYHPHGESVIYPTLVRLGQSWVLRYCLIDPQGNFGSIDGDPPAAMRYTEARLTHAAMALIEDLEKETVDFVPNYDETKQEPTVFPARFPNLLANGASGIAVGMATYIPPHNVVEIIDVTKLLLDDQHTATEDLMHVIQGPDFPTGGIICGYRGIHDLYHTGRGKIVLRALLHVEEAEGGERAKIVVDEIPYGISKADLVQKIAELVNHKQIVGIADIRDESDREGMRLVIELKRGEASEPIINQLYKFSDLQISLGCNMLALHKGMPKTMSLREMVLAWVRHRIEVIQRRVAFELKKAQARAHILEGYLKALDHLDAVVHLIRDSSSRIMAKENLIEHYELSERQANAVLELRLYQLTSLEHNKVEEEHQTLLGRIAHYVAVLGDEQLVREMIKSDLEELRLQHNSPRKTQIMASEGDVDLASLIPDEPAFITISEDDYIKRMPVDTFREQRRGGQGVIGVEMRKETDMVKGVYLASTHDYLLVFTSLGRCYWLKVWDIPEAGRRSKGRPLINLLGELQEGEKIATVLGVRDLAAPETAILLATRRGVIKKTLLEAFDNPRRKGVFAIDIDEGDEVIAVRLTNPGDEVMLFTKNGMAVRFDQDQVRAMGRVARGVRGALLKDPNDAVVSCEVVRETDAILVVCENGFGKRSEVADFRKTHRGGVGVRSIITSERNGAVVGAVLAKDADGMVLMSNAGQTVRICMKDVRVMGRSTQGVCLVHLHSGDHLVSLLRLEAIPTAAL